MDYNEALRWLDSHLDHETMPSGVVAGHVGGLSLEPMRHLMSLLGDPQDQIPAIHITGTNGKGTVAAMITSLLSASGLSVGTYSSPHVARINERITRNAQPIGDEDLAEVLSGVAAVEELMSEPLSWFELVTAAAFRWFAEVPVEVAVIEVGLLGRHDATNVVDSHVSVITTIQGDHTDFAQGWEMAVASEKAGIVKEHSTVVIGEMNDELAAVFHAEGPERLIRMGVDFDIVDDKVALGGHLVDIRGDESIYEEVFIPVRGDHQVANAAIAIAAVEAFFAQPLDIEVVREAFASLAIEGRFEVMGYQPLIVIDGAHNYDAIAATAATLDSEFAPVGRRIVVVGLLEGRDPHRAIEAVNLMRPDLMIATTLPSPRGVTAEVIEGIAGPLGIACEVINDPVEAVSRARRMADEEDLVMIIGSFRMIEPAKAALGTRTS